jgi:hypothetical protein
MTRIKHIVIDIIPNEFQRYSTSGDYFYDKDDHGILHVKVSDMDNDEYNELVAIHEMIEEMLTRNQGVTEPEIMAFDEKYEADRESGLHGDDEEPGFDSQSPYLRQHTIATGVEMILCGELGLSWTDYDKKVMSL